MVRSVLDSFKVVPLRDYPDGGALETRIARLRIGGNVNSFIQVPAPLVEGVLVGALPRPPPPRPEKRACLVYCNVLK